MNTNFIDTQIDVISIHWIGNKVGDEGLIISLKNITIQNELNDLMTHYFVSGFKQQEFYQLFHDTDLKYNEVFGFISNIFNNPNIVHEQLLVLQSIYMNKVRILKSKVANFMWSILKIA